MAAATLPYRLALPPSLGIPLRKKECLAAFQWPGEEANNEAAAPFWGFQTAGYPSRSRISKSSLILLFVPYSPSPCFFSITQS